MKNEVLEMSEFRIVGGLCGIPKGITIDNTILIERNLKGTGLCARLYVDGMRAVTTPMTADYYYPSTVVGWIYNKYCMMYKD